MSRCRSHDSQQSVGSVHTRCRPCPCLVNFTKLCRCDKKPAIFTSLTHKNLIRRFAKCKNEASGTGCGFFEWVDDELCPNVKRHVQSIIARNEYLENELVGLARLRNEREDEKQMNKVIMEKNTRLKTALTFYEAREKTVMWCIVFVAVFVGVLSVVF